MNTLNKGIGDVPWNNEYLKNKMPNLYQFRQEGMELKNHYTYPTCSPSRAALMTGRNAEKLGKFLNANNDDKKSKILKLKRFIALCIKQLCNRLSSKR